jgi:tRNA (mo5U34)-methyltransferase
LTNDRDRLEQVLLGHCAPGTVRATLDAHAGTLRKHGNHDRWRAHLQALNPIDPGWQIERGRLVAAKSFDQPESARGHLQALIPWRKGPLRLGGVNIDTEWRSDWKWKRVQPHVQLSGARVLDVGSGNGYFGWQMLASGAAQVIGCDPTPLFVLQHELISVCAGAADNYLFALRFEDLPEELAGFDAVFSMGVLYHRRDPLDHLRRLFVRLSPSGTLIVETLIVPGDDMRLIPTPDRYAGMRNVHGLPTLALLMSWLREAGFESVCCVDHTPTTVGEQRRTDWMPYHSLEQALDPENASLTKEGLPAPVRAVCLARRPSLSSNA